jgi:hypothetical protein
VIELASTSLLNPNRKYTPLSTEDPGNSRYKIHIHFRTYIIEICLVFLLLINYLVWI